MVITVWLHMFREGRTGAYKKPREFNWCVGVILLVFTLLLSFTGYLLPDDQLGFWAVTVGTNMARATPLLGHEGPFGAQLGMTQANDVRFGLYWVEPSWIRARCCVRTSVALRRDPFDCRCLPGRAFLAHSQGWRHFRTGAGGARIRNEAGVTIWTGDSSGKSFRSRITCRS